MQSRHSSSRSHHLCDIVASTAYGYIYIYIYDSIANYKMRNTSWQQHACHHTFIIKAVRYMCAQCSCVYVCTCMLRVSNSAYNILSPAVLLSTE